MYANGQPASPQHHQQQAPPPPGSQPLPQQQRNSWVAGVMPPPAQWSTGLCDCGNGHCGTLVDAVCCPWCLYGYQVAFFQKYQEYGGLEKQMDCLSCVLAFVGDFIFYGIVTPILHIGVRGAARTRYGIAPDNDCLKACCCTPCSAAQLTREATIKMQWPGSVCTDEVPDGERQVFRPPVPVVVGAPIQQQPGGYPHQQQQGGYPPQQQYPPQKTAAGGY